MGTRLASLVKVTKSTKKNKNVLQLHFRDFQCFMMPYNVEAPSQNDFIS